MSATHPQLDRRPPRAARARVRDARLRSSSTRGARWPRTTGADVIAIAARVRSERCARTARRASLRRWRATLADLERDALTAPRETYAENRTFWASSSRRGLPRRRRGVAAVAGDLGRAARRDRRTVSPQRRADARTARSRTSTASRPTTICGPRSASSSPTSAAPTCCRRRPGSAAATMAVPRTTNADVLQLATYWSDQLANAKQEMGYDGVVEKWHAAIADVDKLAKPGKPDDVYPKNNEFWRRSFDGRGPGRDRRRGAEQVGHGRRARSRTASRTCPRTLEAGASKGAESSRASRTRSARSWRGRQGTARGPRRAGADRCGTARRCS